MGKQDYTEQSQKYAAQKYIEPARRRGDSTVRITAGEIHKALGFRNRVPAVCQALQSRKFLEENQLDLEKVDDPLSGQSTTVSFTYRLKDSGQSSGKTGGDDCFSELRGIAKDIFRNLGGGEAFIRREREHFYSPAGDK